MNTAEVLQFPKGFQVVHADNELGTGYITLHRKLEEEVWARCPVKRVIWEHLLLNATHKPYKTKLGNADVVLQPGQLISGRKKILNKCFDQKLVEVSEDMVRGALNFFKKQGMIETKSTRQGTVFTVLNWEKYQGKNTPKSPQRIPQDNPQQKPSNDAGCSDALPKEAPKAFPTIQEEKTIKDTYVSFGSSDDETANLPAKKSSKFEYPEEFDWIWENRPRREGTDPKRKALQACNARIKQGATWKELAQGMLRYKRFCETKGNINTSFVQQLSTFFGPDEHFKNSWEVTHAESQPALAGPAGTAAARRGIAEQTRNLEDSGWAGSEYDRFGE